MDNETKSKITRRILNKLPNDYSIEDPKLWLWQEDKDEITVKIKMNNWKRGDLIFIWNQQLERKNNG